MNNSTLYNSTKSVNKYTKAYKIQKPEQEFINFLWDAIKDMSLLDLWVWWWRTTLHFAHRVKSYTWTDIAPRLVNWCKKRFFHNKEFSFIVCDASNLKDFWNDSYDIVLFSFNGIDYLDFESREKCLGEVYRVLKKWWYFFFSSHNILSFPSLFWIQKTYNPIKICWRIFRFFMLKFLNDKYESLMKKWKCIINDGSWWYKLKTAYIHPELQIADLVQAWFTNVSQFSIFDWKKITKDLSEAQEDRIYYLAQKS